MLPRRAPPRSALAQGGSEGCHVFKKEGSRSPGRRSVGGQIEENAIADDEASPLFGLKKGDAIGVDVGLEAVSVAGKNVDAGLDVACGVRDPGCSGGDGGQG